jgi:hypothetical protein
MERSPVEMSKDFLVVSATIDPRRADENRAAQIFPRVGSMKNFYRCVIGSFAHVVMARLVRAIHVGTLQRSSQNRPGSPSGR